MVVLFYFSAFIMGMFKLLSTQYQVLGTCLANIVAEKDSHKPQGRKPIAH